MRKILETFVMILFWDRSWNFLCSETLLKCENISKSFGYVFYPFGEVQKPRLAPIPPFFHCLSRNNSLIVGKEEQLESIADLT